MKQLVLFILLLISSATIAQNADSIWLANNYTKIEKQIAMRDGVKLFTAIYLPKDTTTLHPILMNRTPYGCNPYGEANMSPRLYKTYLINYLKQGYIFVFQDVRGKLMSEGDFVDVRPFNPNKKNKEIDEASDTYDAIDWLVKNLPYNNNKVGVFGISYPGFYSTMAALSNHPSLKAVSPQAPVTDWFLGDDFHHNGAFALMDGFNFYSIFGKPRYGLTTQEADGFNFPTQDSYDFYLRTGALKNFTALMGDSVAFWKDLMQHSSYDEWWKARNVRNHLNNVKPASLVVGGLFDAEDCYGAWATYKAIEQKSKNSNNKLVMGPWYHGQWARGNGDYLGNIRFGSKTSEYYQQQIEIPFFNHHLLGKGSLQNLAEATIFFTGENTWKTFNTWPPQPMRFTNYYLQKDGKLSTQNTNSTTNVYTQYISDPAHPVPYTEDVLNERTREYMTDDQRFASRRTDVLSFTSDVLTQDLSLAGPIVANLIASISTTDADFVVKLIDVFSDDFNYNENQDGAGSGKPYIMNGYQMLVRGEILRGKFRNSFEKPEAFVPNQPTKVQLTLPDVAHTFKKGHRIMVQIQSSWFPLFDRNPQTFTNIYNCKDSDFKPSTIRIYHQSKLGSSSISLPIIK